MMHRMYARLRWWAVMGPMFVVLSTPVQVHGAPKPKAATRTKLKARPKRPPSPPADAPVPVLDEPPETVEAPPIETESEPAEAQATSAPAPAEPGAETAFEAPAPPEGEAPLSAEGLRERYDQLRDQVFRSRARRETIEQALLSTKVAFEVRWEANRRYRLEKAEIRLDGTRIWDTAERPLTEDPILLAERPVAPGTHVLTVRLEVRSRDKAEMGYTSEQNFYIGLPEAKASRVRISVDEDGDLPSYNPEVEVKVDGS